MKAFADVICSASEMEIQKDHTLSGRLALDSAPPLTVSYAPFDHIQLSARVVILGITPGIQQATNAILELRRKLLLGSEWSEALSAAKGHASFSGPMRNNLIEMLDFIGLNKTLKIPSTQQLWEPNAKLAHFTSSLRYPVLLNGKNYSGNPSITSNPILVRMLENYLSDEARSLTSAIWIPLGPVATDAANWLITRHLLKSDNVLNGLPHPSGANAERVAYFVGRKERSMLSAKTNALRLDAQRAELMQKVAIL